MVVLRLACYDAFAAGLQVMESQRLVAMIIQPALKQVLISRGASEV
jgi:hypothetical protein